MGMEEQPPPHGDDNEHGELHEATLQGTIEFEAEGFFPGDNTVPANQPAQAGAPPVDPQVEDGKRLFWIISNKKGKRC